MVENVLKSVRDTLEEIHLQNNELEQILNNYMHPSLKALVYLNLSGNQIEDYREILLTRVITTLIKYASIGVQSKWSLKSLHICYNRLRTFNYNHVRVMALEELNLEGNNLYQFDIDSIANMRRGLFSNGTS